MRKAVRHAVAELYAELGRVGLIVGSSGNVSARLPEGMIITPSGGVPGRLKPRDLAQAAFDGTARGKATPSSEWAMHALIYQGAPEAGAIVHTHADACTALACLGEPLPAFHYNVLQFGGTTVPCVPYVTFGTMELAESVAAAIAGHSGCLLANHGMIVHGRDAAEALDRALLLESLCRQYLMLRAAGTPVLLSERDMDDARRRFRRYGPREAWAEDAS